MPILKSPSDTFSQMKEGIILLKQRCDGASSEDGVGFSKHDAALGFGLALKAEAGMPFTPRMVSALQKLCIKYRKQISGLMCDYDIESIKALDIEVLLKGQAKPEKAKPAHSFARVFVSRETEKAFYVEQYKRGHKRAGWVAKSVLPLLALPKQEQDLLMPDWIIEKYDFEKLPKHAPAPAQLQTAV